MEPDVQEAAKQEELESLRAIYAEDSFKVFGTSAISLSAAAGNGQTFEISADIPREYPAKAKPVFKLKPRLPQDQDEALQRELESIIATDDVCMFQAIECIRSFLSQLELTVADSVDANMLENDAQTKVPVKIMHGGMHTVQKSKFQAHVAVVRSVPEVHAVMRELLADKKIAQATHNIMAYRIKIGDTMAADNDDDGEARASSGLLQLLRSINAESTVVVVTRWYGGTLLGSKRFKIINNVARELLVEAGHAQNEASLKR